MIVFTGKVREITCSSISVGPCHHLSHAYNIYMGDSGKFWSKLLHHSHNLELNLNAIYHKSIATDMNFLVVKKKDNSMSTFS